MSPLFLIGTLIVFSVLSSTFFSCLGLTMVVVPGALKYARLPFVDALWSGLGQHLLGYEPSIGNYTISDITNEAKKA